MWLSISPLYSFFKNSSYLAWLLIIFLWMYTKQKYLILWLGIPNWCGESKNSCWPYLKKASKKKIIQINWKIWITWKWYCKFFKVSINKWCVSIIFKTNKWDSFTRSLKSFNILDENVFWSLNTIISIFEKLSFFNFVRIDNKWWKLVERGSFPAFWFPFPIMMWFGKSTSSCIRLTWWCHQPNISFIYFYFIWR